MVAAPPSMLGLLESGKFIPDDRVAEFLSQYCVHSQQKELFDITKISNTELAPPVLWNEFNTRPAKLPGLLYPRGGDGKVILRGAKEDDVLFPPEGGVLPLPKRERGRPKQDTQQSPSDLLIAGYHKVADSLIAEIKENVNLEVNYLKTQPVKLCYANQQTFQKNRKVVLYCMRCWDKKEGNFTRVVAGFFREESRAAGNGNTLKKCCIEITEFWFHDQNCSSGKSRNQEYANPGFGGPLKNGPGFEKIPAPRGSLIEELRGVAYDGWINTMNEYQEPGHQVVDAGGNNPNRIGMPPGSPITFGYHEGESVLDNRTQVPLTDPNAFPPGVDIAAHTQYTTWHIYNYISRYNLTQEFTSHRPHPNPKKAGFPAATLQGGTITLSPDPLRPVHLYVDGIYLIFGGMQLERGGKGLLAPSEQPFLHQMAHGDFATPMLSWPPTDNGRVYDYPLAKESPLLRGLSHPGTFNVAIETSRSMWISNIHQVVTFGKNETLANSADTIHGGLCWNAHQYKNSEGKFLYKPSIHLVLGSTRFPQIRNEVKLDVTAETYCPPQHLAWMSTQDLEDDLAQTIQRARTLSDVLSLPKHLDGCSPISVTTIESLQGAFAAPTQGKKGKATGKRQKP